MTARRPLHVGCSPLTKRIYAGSKSADGKCWLSDQTDVTTEALLAVIEMIGPGYTQALMSTNGGPSFEIEVREIPPPAPPTEDRRAGTGTGPVHEGVVGEAEAPGGPDHDSATAMPGRAEGVREEK